MDGSLAAPAAPHAPMLGGPKSISVVITNYNYGRFLRRCIESVLRQTYEDVECIVVDDGSTDESRDILNEFDSITTIFRQNGGQVAAARAGFARSRGQILIFLDADDFLYPEACASVAAHWAPDISAVQYSLDVRRNDQIEGRFPPTSCEDSEKIAYFLRYGFYPSAPMSGNAFARDYVEFLLRTGQHMDGDGLDAYLLYSAPAWRPTVTIRECLGTYTIHGSNISMTARKTARNLSDHIYYQFWAQQTAYATMRERGIPVTTDENLKGPYNLLWYLVTEGHGSVRFRLPRLSHARVARQAIVQFATWPDIPLFKRVKNIALVAALAVLPATARSRLASLYHR